jgi:hypothetical protein
MQMKTFTIVFLALAIIVLFFPLVSRGLTIPNPLGYDTFEELVTAVINFIFLISLALAPLMVVLAGFYLLTAGGNPANIKKAQTIIIWTAVGLLVVLLAKGLISVIQAVIGVNPSSVPASPPGGGGGGKLK